MITPQFKIRFNGSDLWVQEFTSKYVQEYAILLLTWTVGRPVCIFDLTDPKSARTLTHCKARMW
jgi:hypothetical protein